MQIKFPVQENQELFSFKSFLRNYKDKILMGAAFLLMGLAFFIKLVTGNEKVLNEFYQSNLFLAKFKAEKDVDLKAVSNLVKKHKDLAPIFAPYLEQEYALKGDIKKAKEISEESLKRLSFIDPLYREYAAVSVLIEEGKYKEALARSFIIKEGLTKERLPNLFGLNLVRISFLESILGSSKSLEKWEEAKEAISNELYLHFSDEGLTLFDFAQNK
jgi:hypothetical protein